MKRAGFLPERVATQHIPPWSQIAAFHAGPSYSAGIGLTAGDTVDFVVGFGGNGYSFDSTGAALSRVRRATR